LNISKFLSEDPAQTAGFFLEGNKNLFNQALTNKGIQDTFT
jgi:hypothetical protein